jgi:hypothetical protein
VQDWTNEKLETPFGLMPILYETHPTSGQTLEIPESEAIERHLARKFGFWGKDAWEEIAIHVFYCSSKSVLSWYVNKVLLAFPDTKARELTKFVEKEIPAWISQHEKWLDRSQTPGFYVGNQVSNSSLLPVCPYTPQLACKVSKLPSLISSNYSCLLPISTQWYAWTDS